MSKRQTLSALVLSAFALAALTLFAAPVTAQIDPLGGQTSPRSIAVLDRINLDFAPQKGPDGTAGSVRPVKGIDVIVQKNPGNTAVRTAKTDDKGQVKFVGLDPGNYSLTIAGGSAVARQVTVVTRTDREEAANAGSDSYNYLAVTITGGGLVGNTKTRSLDINKWQFVNPRDSTAKTTTPDTYTNRIEFEIKPITGGGPPPPLQATIIKSKSNISNN